MRTNQELSEATPETIRQQLLETLDDLLAKVVRMHDVLDNVQEVRRLLESLPLATGEFALVCNRLGNAKCYLLSQERGAARFELQLLAGSFRNGQPPIRDTKLRAKGH